MIGVAPPGVRPGGPGDGERPCPSAPPRPCAPTCANCCAGTAGPSRCSIAVNAVAVIASMVGPVAARRRGRASCRDGARDLHLERTAALFAVALVVQTVFVRLVRLRGAMLGEQMLADLREDFLVRSVGLPPGVLERAGTGRPAVPDHHGHRPAGATRCARPCRSWPSAWCGLALLLGGLTVTAPPLAPRGAGRAAAAGDRLPLVLQAGALRLPLGGRRVRRGRRRARRDRGRRAARSRPTGSATAGSPCPSGGSRSGPPGSGTRSGCARCSSPSST